MTLRASIQDANIPLQQSGYSQRLDEFDQVFIPGLDDSQMPFRFELEKKPDETSKDLFIQKERSLLHVAATRAKKRVVITYSGKPSFFI